MLNYRSYDNKSSGTNGICRENGTIGRKTQAGTQSLPKIKIFERGKSEHSSRTARRGKKAEGNSLRPRGRGANSDARAERRKNPKPKGRGLILWRHRGETAKSLLGCKVKHPAQSGVKSKPLEAAKQFAVQINDCLVPPNPAGRHRIRLIAGLGFPFLGSIFRVIARVRPFLKSICCILCSIIFLTAT